MSARPQQRRDQYDTRIEQLRVPPQSVDAEQAVLGGLMLDPNAFDRVADQLTDADFYRRDHQLIYRAIRELAEKNKPFDAVTLGEWFDSQGYAEQIGDGAYLVELATTTPSAANIRAYAEIVRDKAVLRQLIEVGTGIVNDGYQPEGRESAELLAKAEQQVFAIAEAGARGRADFVAVNARLTGVKSWRPREPASAIANTSCSAFASSAALSRPSGWKPSLTIPVPTSISWRSTALSRTISA